MEQEKPYQPSVAEMKKAEEMSNDIENKVALDKLREKLGFSPEKEIQTYDIKIGGKTKDQLKDELKTNNIYISEYADDMMNSKDFITSEKAKDIKLVRLDVFNLGFSEGASTDEIYKKAKELGLNLCPAETGPHFILQNQKKDLILIAMNTIANRHGHPDVFLASRAMSAGVGELELGGTVAGPDQKWDSESEFVFVLNKLES